MTGWILSIVGMVMTITLTEVMLPEGKTANYIKGVISLMIIYVVIAPIPSLLQSKIDINSFFDFSGKSYESDAVFIGIIKEDKQSALDKEIGRIFSGNGVNGASVQVILGENDEVSRVILTAPSSEIHEAYPLTLQYLGVKEEQIVINEIYT